MAAFRKPLTLAAFCVGVLVSLPIIILALPFLIFALAVRAIVHLIEPAYIPWNQIIEFDAALGWKPKRNLNTHYLTLPKDGVFHTITDSEGWPGRSTISESDVVVIGDSFAFGYGVDIGDSFAEKSPSIRIKAIGSPGYNMVQELLVMKELSAKLTGKLVVWFVCVENDLIDNLSPHTFNYRSPFVKRDNAEHGWTIVTDHLRPTKWYYLHDTFKNHPYQGAYLDVLAKLCCASTLSISAYSACEFLIREAKEICFSSGAKLVIMTIPNANQLSARGRNVLLSSGIDQETFDPGFPDKKLREICDGLDVPFMPARAFLDEGDYKELDTHWNTRGHQRIARAFGDLYRDHLLPTREGARSRRLLVEAAS